jgi:hypothetical protein
MTLSSPDAALVLRRSCESVRIRVREVLPPGIHREPVPGFGDGRGTSADHATSAVTSVLLLGVGSPLRSMDSESVSLCSTCKDIAALLNIRDIPRFDRVHHCTRPSMPHLFSSKISRKHSDAHITIWPSPSSRSTYASVKRRIYTPELNSTSIYTSHPQLPSHHSKTSLPWASAP